MNNDIQDQRSQDKKSQYQVLARKYRPSSLTGLIGQEAMVRTLTNAFEKNRIAHAFMLTGVRGVGKTSTARIIALSINCTGRSSSNGPTVNPCGQCETCVSITADRHVDVLEMDAASQTGVENIRELIEGTGYRPISARFKIYIIDEVHMLSKSAFNALLKTLEEPPEHVKFIFATTEIRKVPVTILSRCQRFDLRRIPSDILTDHLSNICKEESIEVTRIALELIARAADGSARDGLSLLDRAISFSDGNITEKHIQMMLGAADNSAIFEIIEAIFSGNIAVALDILERIYQSGADPVNIIEDMLGTIHWLTKVHVTPSILDGKNVLKTEHKFALKMKESIRISELTRAWQMLLKGLNELREAPSTFHATEMILIRLGYASTLPTPEEALKFVSEKQVINSDKQTSSIASDHPIQSSSKKKSKGKTLGFVPTETHGSSLAPSKPPIPKTFDEVAALAESHREGRLSYFLVHQARVVNFEPGILILNKDAKNEHLHIKELKFFLEKQTNILWDVKFSTEKGEETLFTKRTLAEEKCTQKSLEDPVVQAVMKTFPKATVSKIRKLS